MESGQQSLDEAQATYDDYLETGYLGDPTFMPDPNSDEAKALQSAQSTYDRAVAQCNIATRGSDSTSQLESAQASYDQAQSSYDDLLDGPNEDALLAAELALRQAQIKLAQAQESLDNATLVAPFDGVITDVSLVIGQSSGSGAITIADISRLHVDVSVDELDVVNVSVGQVARLTLEAFDSAEVAGTVVSIAPLGTQTQGLVTYTVRVDLDSTSAVADATTSAGTPTGASAGAPVGTDTTAGTTAGATADTTSAPTAGAGTGFASGGLAAGGAGGFSGLREVIPAVMQLGTVDEINAMLAGDGGEDAFYAALADASVSEDAITQIKDAGGPSVVVAMLERFSQAGDGQAPGGFVPGGQTVDSATGTDSTASASEELPAAGQDQGAAPAAVDPTAANQAAPAANTQAASAALPIRLGMTVDVELVISSLENVLVVPTSAIQRQGQQEYLVVDDGAGGQTQVTVTTGETVSGMTVVEGDVSEGQTIYYTVTTSSSTSTSGFGGGGAAGGGSFGILTGGGRP